MSGEIAQTPEPPYYAVIFTNSLAGTEPHPEYAAVAARMVELAMQQPGYLGHESVREGLDGVTISYWKDLQSIRSWREHAEHTAARKYGREAFYRCFKARIARVERDYGFEAL